MKAFVRLIAGMGDTAARRLATGDGRQAGGGGGSDQYESRAPVFSRLPPTPTATC